MSKNKISMFQVTAMFMLLVIAPIVRGFPVRAAGIGGKAAWVAALVSIIPNILIVLIVHSLMNNVKEKNGRILESLTDVFDAVFGKVIGSILAATYVIWLILWAAIEIRLVAERLTSTMLIYTPYRFFLITMLIVIFFFVRGNIKSYGRFAEVMLELFGLVLIFICFTVLPNIDIKNLWPVTTYDTKNIAFASTQSTGLFSIFTFSMFIGNKIEDKEKIKKFGIGAAIATGIIGAIGTAITIGIFSPEVVAALSQPFFMALKVINVFGVLERIEAIFITFWIVADFMAVSYCILMATNICKIKCKLSNRRITVTPIMLILYILSIVIANSYFSLQIVAADICLTLHLVFGLAIPLLAYVIARMRNMIKSTSSEN